VNRKSRSRRLRDGCRVKVKTCSPLSCLRLGRWRWRSLRSCRLRHRCRLDRWRWGRLWLLGAAYTAQLYPACGADLQCPLIQLTQFLAANDVRNEGKHNLVFAMLGGGLAEQIVQNRNL